jgi:rhomboid family GlyGly-CTERM serine protease
LTAGERAWIGLAAGLGMAGLAATLAGIAPGALDWQPARAHAEPWRAFSAVAVHYSALHLAANLLGAALVAALGAAAGVPRAMVVAWACAWPLTQFGLWIRPDLSHYGGLSGVLHAGAAVAAVHLMRHGPGGRRWIGATLMAGLLCKVLLEAPWGPALRVDTGWDFATAPLAHATGVAAGTLCALAAIALRLRSPTLRPDV